MYAETDIKHVQNTLWGMYKSFLQDHDMRGFNQKMQDLVRSYSDKKEMVNFCQNLILAWCPVMNYLAAEYRRTQGGES